MTDSDKRSQDIDIPKMTEEIVETKRVDWPDPTPEMMKSFEFNAIWDLIKTWDIGVPNVYCGYTGATGNHVCAILRAISKARPETIKSMVKKLQYSDLGGSTRKAIVDKLSEAISDNIT